jgi:hypothetical protein
MKNILLRVIKFVQKIVITVLLFLVYMVAIGAGFVCVKIHSLGRIWKKGTEEDTFWKGTEGYAADLERCRRQS